MIYDSHVDTPSRLIEGLNMGIDNPKSHIDFPKLKSGGVDGSFFALYTGAELSTEEARDKADRMLAATLALPGKYNCRITTTPREAASNRENGVFSIFIGMENGSPIGSSLEKLEEYFIQGVRYLTLTHNGDNLIADSAAQGTRWGGLSPFGREVVTLSNRLGLMVDLSHSSDSTFWDCLRYSKAPLIASHSCCRSICSHRRNLTDEMLRALGENEGYVGINFYPCFLSDNYETVLPGASDIVDHIERAVELCGVDHVGIGSDYDGIEITPAGMENVGKIFLVFDEMRRRGFSEEEIQKIGGGNLMAVLERIMSCSLL